MLEKVYFIWSLYIAISLTKHFQLSYDKENKSLSSQNSLNSRTNLNDNEYVIKTDLQNKLVLFCHLRLDDCKFYRTYFIARILLISISTDYVSVGTYLLSPSTIE